MALNAPCGRSLLSGSRCWNVWTALTLALVASLFWIPVSSAAALARRDSIANDVELRVLPIGDSITFGVGSSTGGDATTGYNGYRKSLYETLKGRGNSVDFVGGLRSGHGDIADKDNEGHRGETINEIARHSLEGIYAAPNIVLLHAGTNNMKTASDATNAPSDLESLIDLILSRSPNAAVLVCQIIPADGSRSTYADFPSRIETFNKAIPAIVKGFTDDGKNVAVVDMHSAVSISQLADGLHPNDDGYENMTETYYAAIQQADEDGWITKPDEGSTPPTSTTDTENCRSTPSWYNVGQIADGAKVAESDGVFEPAFAKQVIIADGACKRSQLHFMDLDGDGLKDYACVDPDTGETKVHINIPDSEGKSANKWDDRGSIATGAENRNGTGVLFADLNGDGRDDYIWVDPRNGAISAWINRGEKDSVWQWQGLGVITSTGIGATTKNVQLADIDGDGRADLLIVSPTTGAVTAWLNTGADIIPDWHKLGIIASGATASSGDTVVFGDFTGEGRADYMIIGDGGKVIGLVNRLSETTLAPRWLSAITFAEGPDDIEQEEVRLVDMTGDGKVDYLSVSSKGKVILWENKGSGGKYQPGEGVFLCDLDGDLTNDYFWIDHEGRGWGYLNKGKGTNAWHDLGQIAQGGYDREQIRMGVLTKSRRADYIVVDEKTGAADWWQNLGEEWNYEWAGRGEAATGPYKTIENTFGWKFSGKNVRFADLDGDGLDDYVYIGDQGAVVYWKNVGTASATTKPSWGLPHLVADGPGVLAQEVQFADTNGDKLLDYVVVSRITGKTRTWHNLGFHKNSDDSLAIRWNTPLSFAERTGSAGFAIKISEMTGDRRADYVSIDPDTGRLNLWKNRCWAIDDGDDGDDDDDDGGDDDDKPWNDRTEWEWCHLATQQGFSSAQKSYIWGSDENGLGVGQYLDELLVEEKEENWVDNLRKAYQDDFPDDDDFSSMVCNDISSNAKCLITTSPSCENWYKAGAAPLYWVFRSVANLDDTLVHISDALSETYIKENMNKTTVIQKFKKGEESTLAMDIFTTAFSAASALTAANAPVSGTLAGISSVMTLIGQLDPDDENKDDLLADGALLMLYEATARGLRALLHLAVEGKFTEPSDPLDASDLPDLGDTSYQTSIAKFFRDGRWLIDNQGLESDMIEWQNNFEDMTTQAVVTALLSNQDWFVWIDEDLNTEASCSRTEGTNNDGRRWIDGWCYDLWVWKRDINSKDGLYTANSADGETDAKFKAMQEPGWGDADLAEIYKNAIDCALKYPDGDGVASADDLEILVGGASVCFFNYPVIRGIRNEEPSGTGKASFLILPPNSEPLINTSERHEGWW
ncbi:Fc.00g011180.m01.CDS01 [Cosmosporella sp. VM-42]